MSGGFYAGKGGGKGGGAKARAEPAGPPLPGGLLRKLQALNYPEVETVSLSGQAYCKVVLWLEEEKIRLYEKPARKPLREFNRAWYEHVQEYCSELAIPAEDFTEKNMASKLRVLNGLANLAVHDIYRDQVEANELAMAAPAKAAPAGERRQLDSLLGPLNKLLESFALPKLPDDASDSDIIAGLKCVHVRVCPPKETGAEPLDLDKLPVGLQIEDPEVKRAAAVLRILHGIELQQLQMNINQVVNELQQLTANPKTDSRLGRVGR